MPTIRTPSGKSLDAATIAPDSAAHTGHHEAQNHSATSWYISEVPSMASPVTRSAAMNLSASGASGLAHSASSGEAAADPEELASAPSTDGDAQPENASPQAATRAIQLVFT